MLVFSIIIMIGLSLILFPQWRDNERLPFPLLAVQQALVETPEEGGRVPAVFRSPIFWGAAFLVFLVFFFNGMAGITDKAWPTIGTGWGFWGETSGTMFSRMHWWVIQGGISFTIIGIVYFVPNRISFSIWATVVLYQIYVVIGFEFFAPFHGKTAVADHRSGAVMGVAAVILWLGRKQWVAVLKSMFSPAKNDADRRNRLARFIFSAGCAALFLWELYYGNSLGCALLAVFMVVISSLVLARIVAETGIPVMGNSLLTSYATGMLPMGWLSAKAIYLTNATDLVIGPGASKVSAVVTAMHGYGIDRDQTPRGHMRLAKVFILVLVLGIMVAGAVHFTMGYENPVGLDGRNGAVGAGMAGSIEASMHNPLKNFDRGNWGKASHNRLGHFIFGAILAFGLQIACLLSPLWPFHPAGLVIMDSTFIQAAWPSILIGWAIKRSVVIYGGAKAYRMARPLFLGLVVGGVFSAIAWAVIPVILVWNGADPAEIMAR